MVFAGTGARKFPGAAGNFARGEQGGVGIEPAAPHPRVAAAKEQSPQRHLGGREHSYIVRLPLVSLVIHCSLTYPKVLYIVIH